MTIQTIKISTNTNLFALWSDEPTPQLVRIGIKSNVGMGRANLVEVQDLDKLIIELQQLKEDAESQIKVKRRREAAELEQQR